MAEENNDANTGTEDAAGADSSSDAVDLEPIVDDDGLVSTMEYQRVEKEESAEDIEDADTSGDAEQNTSEDQTSEKQDFHEHPRFKELVEEKNNLKAEIDALKEQIKTPSKTDDSQQSEQVNFQNIMSMEDDDIVDELTSNPKKFLANFANQLAHEFKTDLEARETTKKAEAETLSMKEQAAKTVNDFFSDKEDGKAMLDDGRIKAFIKDNPGHNEISAYHSLAGEDAVNAKIESAVKAREKEIYKELKAKGKAKSTATPTGGGILSEGKTPEMKNPDKFGGRDTVLLNRLLARQAP
jgi:hypothetical protein